MNWQGLGFNNELITVSCLRGRIFFPKILLLILPSFFPDVLKYILHCFKTTLIFNTIICKFPLFTEGFFQIIKSFFIQILLSLVRTITLCCTPKAVPQMKATDINYWWLLCPLGSEIESPVSVQDLFQTRGNESRCRDMLELCALICSVSIGRWLTSTRGWEEKMVTARAVIASEELGWCVFLVPALQSERSFFFLIVVMCHHWGMWQHLTGGESPSVPVLHPT